MPEPGWPTLADVHREVTATRADVRALCVRLDAQAQALAQHRLDDRRELDELDTTVTRLDRRERWLAGGLAVLGLLVLAGVPTLVMMVGG